MEQEFDKDIDALLRNLRPAGSLRDTDPVSAHLEADELAAIAENALPSAKRQALTLHLADCGRCRKILSDTVRMNSQAAPIAAAAAGAPAVPAAASEAPWYRRLLLFPNLAYVTGGLVLVFSAFLGFVILRDAGTREATISQAIYNESPAANVPDAEQPDYMASANTTANASANAAVSNTTTAGGAAVNGNGAVASSNTTVFGDAGTKREDAAAAGAPLTAPVLDGVSAAETAPPPAAADATTTRDERAKLAELSKEKDDKGMAARSSAPGIAQEREESKLRAMPSAAAKKSSPAGPSRDLQTQFPNRAQNYYEQFPMKNAGGKKFELRDGVWYDTAYRGQSTTTVRRGTEAFLRLDGGLRSIAESVGGTSVIVWNGKAYRIQ